MYHSITFGNMNTWDDWHLVPTSRPLFKRPSLKQKKVEIPGADGDINVSTSLTGYPLFNNRTGTFEFIVMNDYKPWEEAYSDIMNYIHGRTMQAFLEDDPTYYYEGVFKFNDWKSEKNNSKIVIDYDVSPYKRKRETSYFDDILIMPTSRSVTITKNFYDLAPVNPYFTLKTSSGTGADIRLVNSALRLDVTHHIADGTSQLHDFIFYGDSVTIYTTVDGSAINLQDSNGANILDSSDNVIGGTNNGVLTISCNPGRL